MKETIDQNGAGADKTAKFFTYHTLTRVQTPEPAILAAENTPLCHWHQ